MRRSYRYLSAVLLGAALILPMSAQPAIHPSTVPQDRDRDQDKDRDRDKRERRYYDRAHRDYHNWDADEDARYRRWLNEERHEKYRDYDHLGRRDRDAYWRWRHDHPETH